MRKIILIIGIVQTVAAQIPTMNDNIVPDAVPQGMPLSGSCASPDGPNKEIASPPADHQELVDNGYCIYSYPVTSTTTACFTVTITGTDVDFNAGSSETCNNTSFNNFRLYNSSCVQVGTGLSFTGLTPGVYTWCLSMRAWGGPVCNGFTTFCPYYIDQTVMPVKMSQYSVSVGDNNYVNINWRTEMEINNEVFYVMRSPDNKRYETLFTIDGLGNSSTGGQYHVTDNAPNLGTSYYKIVQKDYDGTMYEFPAIPINVSDSFDIKIIPNPSQGHFKIGVYNVVDDFSIHIYDNKGAVAYTATHEVQDNLEVPINLNTGIYLIDIKWLNGRKSEKIIVR